MRGLAAGYGCMFASDEAGAVWAWGRGYDGQLGDGTAEERKAPARIPGLDGVVAIANGLALRHDGSVWAWGGDAAVDDLGAEAGLPVGCSKLGGRPDVPPGFRWPRHQHRPLEFVAQVDLGDVARQDATGTLPHAGLLSFFYELLVDPLGDTVSAVLLTDADAPLTRMEFPEALADHARRPAVRMVPEVDLTLYPWAAADLDAQERDAFYELTDDGRTRRHRMLGYPDLIQDNPAPGAAVLLLQVDLYDEAAFPGGAGMLYFLISESDLAQRRFSRVVADYECD